ncbi:hypothetical protein NKI98_21955 [Mesorhizobium sp. M0222]|uniref:hypothetical protein n=1 Tax=Mesorhizobium sp. M0222 TaxID=2956921 RepID=UPI003334FBD3
MTTDEKALASVRRPDFDPHDRFVTMEAVATYLATFHDQHPDGRSIIEHQTTEQWQGLVSEIGMCVYRPTVFEIMQRTTDPKTLTDREVLFLVMTADCPDTYTAADWDAMVAQRLEAANNRREAAKRKERKDHNDERAERGGRERLTLNPVPGQRVIPDEALSQRAKMRRTKSLKTAQERRRLRRMTALGIVVQPSKDQWRTMNPEQVKQYHQTIERLVTMGTLDPLTVDDIENPEGSPIAYLYRMGRMTSKGDRA